MSRQPANPSRLTRVLFVCVGNACRSQMAEGFARAYGSDVLDVMSAGLAPAVCIPPDTVRAMLEKNIDLGGHFPKSWRHLAGREFDLVVNMSGRELPPGVAAPQRVWNVPDPYLLEYAEMCRVRDQIELYVMSLILELRRAAKRGARR
ncbi:MAG: arsenate reductase ArsC [Bryobacteraceae bacterium]